MRERAKRSEPGGAERGVGAPASGDIRGAPRAPPRWTGQPTSGPRSAAIRPSPTSRSSSNWLNTRTRCSRPSGRTDDPLKTPTRGSAADRDLVPGRRTLSSPPFPDVGRSAAGADVVATHGLVARRPVGFRVLLRQRAFTLAADRHHGARHRRSRHAVQRRVRRAPPAAALARRRQPHPAVGNAGRRHADVAANRHESDVQRLGRAARDHQRPGGVDRDPGGHVRRRCSGGAGAGGAGQLEPVRAAGRAADPWHGFQRRRQRFSARDHPLARTLARTIRRRARCHRPVARRRWDLACHRRHHAAVISVSESGSPGVAAISRRGRAVSGRHDAVALDVQRDGAASAGRERRSGGGRSDLPLERRVPTGIGGHRDLRNQGRTRSSTRCRTRRSSPATFATRSSRFSRLSGCCS